MCCILIVVLCNAESTWNFLCQTDTSSPYVTTIDATYKEIQVQAHHSLEQIKQRRMSFDGRHRRLSLKEGSSLDQGEKTKYSELELHAIKTAFSSINSLWRDISLGTDQIQMSALTNIHQHLGEIGSDLFRSIFLKSSLPTVVLNPLF